MVRIVAGFAVLLVGLILILPGVPGPGVPFIILGLSILAVDFGWAHRLEKKIKDIATKVINKARGQKDK